MCWLAFHHHNEIKAQSIFKKEKVYFGSSFYRFSFVTEQYLGFGPVKGSISSRENAGDPHD